MIFRLLRHCSSVARLIRQPTNVRSIEKCRAVRESVIVRLTGRQSPFCSIHSGCWLRRASGSGAEAAVERNCQADRVIFISDGSGDQQIAATARPSDSYEVVPLLFRVIGSVLLLDLTKTSRSVSCS